MDNLLSCMVRSAYYYTIIFIREVRVVLCNHSDCGEVGILVKCCVNIFKLILLHDFELALLKSHWKSDRQ